jgi:hypothetical protein
MDEIKVLLQSLVEKALCARNEKDEDKEEEEKAENKKAKNEDVDKRDIIRQIMAIAGKEEASEDVKTIAKLAEKLAYDKSEAGTADNKAKNEDEEEDKKEADNCKAKNEDEEDEKEDKDIEYEELKEKVQKEAENKKAKNALEEVKKVFFEGKVESTSKFMSQKDGIELGKKLY